MKCLDTSLLIDITRDNPGAQRAAREALLDGAVTTEINVFELYVGAYRGGQPVPRKMEAAATVLRGLDILPLTHRATLKAAETASWLRSRGQEMGALDVLIAAIALTNGVDTVVTIDAEDFGRIPGIRVETY